MDAKYYVIMEYFISPEGWSYADLIGVYTSLDIAYTELEKRKILLREKSAKNNFTIIYDEIGAFVAGDDEYRSGSKEFIQGPPHICALVYDTSN